MNIIHTSPKKITKITKDGLFGDCLFFSSNEYATGNVECIYTIDIDEDKIICVSELYDVNIVNDIVDEFKSCDVVIGEEDAEDLLCSYKEAYDYAPDDCTDCSVFGELSWYIQKKQGECAKKMGYEAAESVDEQGTVYIVPMFGREEDLHIIEK